MNIQSIRDRFARELEAETCPIHGKHPEITWIGERFQVLCCCDDFSAHIKDKAESSYADAVARELTDIFRMP